MTGTNTYNIVDMSDYVMGEGKGVSESEIKNNMYKRQYV